MPAGEDPRIDWRASGPGDAPHTGRPRAHMHRPSVRGGAAGPGARRDLGRRAECLRQAVGFRYYHPERHFLPARAKPEVMRRLKCCARGAGAVSASAKDTGRRARQPTSLSERLREVPHRLAQSPVLPKKHAGPHTSPPASKFLFTGHDPLGRSGQKTVLVCCSDLVCEQTVCCTRGIRCTREAS